MHLKKIIIPGGSE